MRRWLFLICVICPLVNAPAQSSWQLVWSDEFNGAAGALPDATKWTYDLGNNNGWGNRELETYSNDPVNAHMDGKGNLVIHAERTASGGYTSARIKTQGLFAAGPGRVEARIKIPQGKGLWPAFWMLGNTFDTRNWPQCGEIDIMESIGKEPSLNHGSLHGPGYSGARPKTAIYELPDARKFADSFHTFSIDWTPTSVAFYVDETAYNTVRNTDIPAGAQ
jgi:beta-glucanase (GH16 family)